MLRLDAWRVERRLVPAMAAAWQRYCRVLCTAVGGGGNVDGRGYESVDVLGMIAWHACKAARSMQGWVSAPSGRVVWGSATRLPGGTSQNSPESSPCVADTINHSTTRAVHGLTRRSKTDLYEYHEYIHSEMRKTRQNTRLLFFGPLVLQSCAIQSSLSMSFVSS